MKTENRDSVTSISFQRTSFSNRDILKIHVKTMSFVHPIGHKTSDYTLAYPRTKIYRHRQFHSCGENTRTRDKGLNKTKEHKQSSLVYSTLGAAQHMASILDGSDIL